MGTTCEFFPSDEKVPVVSWNKRQREWDAMSNLVKNYKEILLGTVAVSLGIWKISLQILSGIQTIAKGQTGEGIKWLKFEGREVELIY